MLRVSWLIRQPIHRRTELQSQKLKWLSQILHKTRGYTTKPKDRINYNDSALYNRDEDNISEAIAFKQVTANDLESLDAPPRSVKMLARDFIENSLYNPNYGYFSKYATILTTPEKSFDFNSMKDLNEFDSALAKRYAEYGIPKAGLGRQIWHTPTELFKVCHIRIVRYIEN